MPAGQGKDEERFAAGFGPPFGADDELAHELALAAALDRSRTSLSPDREATARMRQRLFAAMAEQQAEEHGFGAAAAAATDPTVPLASVPAAATEEVPRSRRARHQMPAGASDRSRSGRNTRRPTAPSMRRRAGLVSTAALAVLVALAGTGAFVSRDALPGDPLYGIKRATESVALAMTSGDEAKAHRQLDLATTRLGEIEQLLGRQHTSAADPQLLKAAMNAFDAATSEGSRMLLASSRQSGGAGLGDLGTWAAQQSSRLAALRSALPDPMVADADQSLALLNRLQSRTEALRLRTGCPEVSSGAIDDLGPVPAQGTCTPGTDQQTQPSGAKKSASAGSTTIQRNSRSSAASPSSDPSTSPSPQPKDDGLLSGLGSVSGGLTGPTSEPGAGSAPNSTSAKPQPVSVPMPVPLLPPIQLPPLIPGQPGITIG